MADELTHLLAGALSAEASAVSSWHDPSASALAAHRSIARKRARRSLATGGAGLLAAVGIGGALILGMGLRDDVVIPASPTAISPLPTAPTPSEATSPTPSPTDDRDPKDWTSVDEADKPAWIAIQNPAETRARALEEWVWDYVDDGWSPWVYTERVTGEDEISSQALFLEAPNGDQFRLFDLSAEYPIVMEHWDPDQRVAWLKQCPGGDSCATVQVDLASGETTADWGGVAIPQRAISDWGPEGVTNVGLVAELPSGDELWALYSYYGTYDGFFLRGADGTFREAPGADQIDSAIESGVINGAGDPGIEAWLTDDYHYAIVLVQTALAYQNDPGVIHSASGAWIVTDLWNGTSTATQPFVPVPPLCAADPSLVPAGDGAIPASVTATCGGIAYTLVPLTAEATVSPN